MAHYVRLCRFTEKGLKQLDKPGELFALIRRQVEACGCKLETAYITLGVYDFVAVIEAPSEDAMKKYAQEVQKLDLYTVKTLTAFPADSFVQWAAGAFSPFLSYWMQQRGRPTR
ncbi:MAG: GYD domain-containing protein [Myxococcales bacterium]|nr:GYD domain-containing protein [Myxococcales bacterium]